MISNNYELFITLIDQIVEKFWCTRTHIVEPRFGKNAGRTRWYEAKIQFERCWQCHKARLLGTKTSFAIYHVSCLGSTHPIVHANPALGCRRRVMQHEASFVSSQGDGPRIGKKKDVVDYPPPKVVAYGRFFMEQVRPGSRPGCHLFTMDMMSGNRTANYFASK